MLRREWISGFLLLLTWACCRDPVGLSTCDVTKTAPGYFLCPPRIHDSNWELGHEDDAINVACQADRPNRTTLVL